MSKASAFIFGIAGALLVLGLAALIMPMYSDYRSRAAASSTLAAMSIVQKQIAENSLKRQTMDNAGMDIAIPKATKEIQWVKISGDGTLVAITPKFGQVFVLMPSYIDGKIEWQCVAGSRKDVPPNCRSFDTKFEANR